MTDRDRRILKAMMDEADDWHVVDPETGAEITQEGGTPVTPAQLKSLLAGGSAVVGPTRRVVTLADGPFSIVPEVGIHRHYGPGAHPGTGTEQEVHAGDGAGVSEEAKATPAAPEE